MPSVKRFRQSLNTERWLVDALSSDGDDLEDDPCPAVGYNLLTGELARKAGAEVGVLVVNDRADDVVEVIGSWGEVPPVYDFALAPAGGFVGRVLMSEHAIAEPFESADDCSFGRPGLDRPIRYAIGSPIDTPRGLVGALCLGFADGAPSDESTVRWLVATYAQLASLFLEDPTALDGLLAGSRHDALTGCLNHASITQVVAHEIRRAERHGSDLSCCFIDLDHFKRFNDTYGHLAANLVLVQVAALLRASMRDGDSLGRFGGDEFVAVLPETKEHGAVQLSERLLHRLSAGSWQGPYASVGASIGVAQWTPGSSPEEFLQAADDALRKAKAAGGGVTVSGDGIPWSSPAWGRRG
jgi:diguanylate cyclase (GGDEF)-like protein